MDVRVEPYRKLSAKAFMLLNCDVGEDTWESRGLQGCQSSQSKRKKSWIFIERTDAEAETPILWSPDAKNWLLGKKPDAGKDWRQEEKGTTGWDGWIALLSPLTWVWASSRNWWWRDKPVMLQSMKLQSWTWLSNWTELNLCGCKYIYNYYIFFSDWFLDHCVVSFLSLLISSFQSLSCVRLFVTPWIAARQVSLSINNSWSSPKLMSIESVMPSNHFIFCCPLLLLPSMIPSIRVFSNELVLHMRWPKYWNFSFSVSPSERLLLNYKRCQDSWPPEEKNSIWGQRQGLITQNFCVIEFY